MALQTCTIGFPRIGPNREMKKALERYETFCPPADVVPIHLPLVAATICLKKHGTQKQTHMPSFSNSGSAALFLLEVVCCVL